MQKSKLGLDFEKVKHAKEVARRIAEDVQSFVEGYSTVAVERTLCRLLGIDGIDANEVPLPNVLVNSLKEKGVLGEGVMYFLGNAIIETGLDPQHIAEQVAESKLDITELPTHTAEEVAKALHPYVDQALTRIKDRRAK
ncbi:MAG: lysine 5,6-aminomutase subunit alpha TIM-barrel domain-containing protein, partial [Lepagella sp.]